MKLEKSFMSALGHHKRASHKRKIFGFWRIEGYFSKK